MTRRLRGATKIPDRGLVPLMTNTQAAAYLNCSPRTLEARRCRTSDGPIFVKISPKSIRYRKSDLDAWIESRLRKSTSDDGQWNPQLKALRGERS